MYCTLSFTEISFNIFFEAVFLKLRKLQLGRRGKIQKRVRELFSLVSYLILYSELHASSLDFQIYVYI